MDDRILITEISNVFFVNRDRHPEKITSFESNLLRSELIYHISGEATVYFGGEELRTSPNSLRFLPEGRFSRYDVVRHSPGECIVVYFKTDRPVAGAAFVRELGKREHIGELFKQMLLVWTARDDGYYYECVSKLYKIFAELEKRSYVPKSHYEKIRPAVDAIHSGFPERSFTTRELAEIAGISEAYLKRLFNERFGMPPKKYMIRMRINHASELLCLGHYTVTEVAEMSGFSDVYFFSRQFKAYTGLTPTEYSLRSLTSRA